MSLTCNPPSMYNEPVTPGNMAAQRASAADYIKPGFDDLSPPKGGNLQVYTISTAVSEQPTEAPAAPAPEEKAGE